MTDDLDDVLASVEPAGGEVHVGEHPSPDGVSYAIVADSEGNRIGLMADG